MEQRSLTDLRKRLDEASVNEDEASVNEDEAVFQFKRIAPAIATAYPQVKKMTARGRLLSIVARVSDDQFPSRASVELYNEYAFPVTQKGEAILHVWGNIGSSSQKACEFVAGLLSKAGIKCRVTKFKGNFVVAFMPVDRVYESSDGRPTVKSVLGGLGFVRTRADHGPIDGYYSTDDGGPVDTMQIHDGLIRAGLKMATHYLHASMGGREFPKYSSYSIEHLGGGTNVTLHWATEGDPEFTKGVTVHSYTTRD